MIVMLAVKEVHGVIHGRLSRKFFLQVIQFFFGGGTYNIISQPWSAHNKPTVHFRQSGTSGIPITIRNFASESPILDGVSNSTNAILGTHDDFNVDYNIFDGIEVTSTAATAGNLMGLRSGGTGHVIQNCKIHGSTLPGIPDNVSGIRIEPTTNALIKNCEIFDIHNSTEDANASCMTIFASSNIEIVNCEMYDAPAGIHLKTGTGDTPNITLHLSYLHDLTTYGVGVSFANLDFINDFQVFNNIFADCASCTKQDSGGDTGEVTDMLFYNNTCTGYTGLGYSSPEYQSSTGFKAYNNIFYRTSTITAEDLRTYDASPNCSGASVVINTLNYNLYFNNANGFKVKYGHARCDESYTTLASWQTSGHGYDADSIEGSDPLFVGPLTSAVGFKLQGGSPAIDLGRTGGTSAGSTVDVGAYETGSETIGLLPAVIPVVSIPELIGFIS